MNSLEIQRLKRSINHSLEELRVLNHALADVLNQLHSLRAGISELAMEMNFLPAGNEHTKRVIHLLRSYLMKDEERDALLRDLDIEAAKTAAYISVAIDTAMIERNTNLMLFIRRSLDELKKGYAVKVSDTISVRLSPSASTLGILIPYLVRTRTLDDASRFASIRNGIRELTR